MGGGLFDVMNTGLLLIIAAVMLYPIVNVLAISLSSYNAYIHNPLMIFPKDITFAAFIYVFVNPLILSGYVNTIIVTVIGTVLSVILTVTTAYPLARKGLKGKTLFLNLIIFTMLFNGGIIPNFYLMRSLGLINTLSALILPGMLNAFNIILMKNFFEGLPDSLEEAAKIDGAGDFYILWKIALPLSKPILATIALFSAVGYWNSYFNAIMYIRDRGKWTLQLILRDIISSAETQTLTSGGNMAELSQQLPAQSLKYATLVVVIVPILCIYPFLQKYFVKGITVGAVKG